MVGRKLSSISTQKKHLKAWQLLLVGAVGLLVGWLVGGLIGAYITVFLGQLMLLFGFVQLIREAIAERKQRKRARPKPQPTTNHGPITAEMKNRKRRDWSFSRKKLFVSLLALAVIGAGLWFGVQAYSDWNNRLVYSTDETMRFADFTVDFVDYSVMDKSGMSSDDLVVNGKILPKDDCSKYATTNDSYQDRYSGRISFWDMPSLEESACERKNAQLDVYPAYEDEHKMIALNINITANKSTIVNVADVRTYVNLPSGRDVTNSLDFPDKYEQYTPYAVSSMNGQLNGGLTRTVNMWTDLKNDENLVDIVIKYNNQQKLYRLEL